MSKKVIGKDKELETEYLEMTELELLEELKRKKKIKLTGGNKHGIINPGP